MSPNILVLQLEIEMEGGILTGTFFCDNTTAQSFPLIPIDMIFAAVIALKAYSILVPVVSNVLRGYINGTLKRFPDGRCVECGSY
jgi:hypothetical protein